MAAVKPEPLPEGALLQRYRANGDYTDCYCSSVPMSVALADYIEAFYNSWLFRIERHLLRWAVSRPSDDTQPRQLVAGTLDHYAAWHVEARGHQQLLLCDFRGSTRSWFMVAADNGATRLYFGSAVVANRRSGRVPWAMRALLGFHQLYSRALLSAARSKLLRRHPQ